MKHDAQPQPSAAAEVYPLGVPAVDYAGRTMRAWLDGAQQLQEEAAEFLRTRAAKDMAVLSEWAQCRTAADALEMQARYANEAWADYVVGTQRLWDAALAAGRADL
jgi:hypothetical protein